MRQGRPVLLTSGFALIASVSASMTIGCADLTRVTNPSIQQPSAFDNAAGAIERRNGALRDFAVAFGNLVKASGLITDELTDSQGAFAYADLRDVSDATASNAGFPYAGLASARLEALRAISTIRQYHATAQSRIGELFALVGYVETFFAEDMCSGVPLGSVVNGTPTLGPTLSRAELLNRAAADFDSAAANALDSSAAPDSTIVALAHLGKARVLANSGQWTAAAAIATTVPVNFVYQAQYALPGENQDNNLATAFASQSISVSDDEGSNGLDFVSGKDPRVSVDTVANFGANAQQTGYGYLPALATQNPALTLASGLEGELIVAEASLNSGNVSAWASTLNSIRQQFGGPSLSNQLITPDSTTIASATLRVTVHFRERAFWLFLTGHRQGDLRRMIRQYQRSANATFPVGTYAGGPGLQYGNGVTFIPYGETNNPQFRGCIDRDP
jgi:hypothetical protein